MNRAITPAAIPAPLANYSHGIETPPGARLLVTSGQLGSEPGGAIPDGAEAQARLCFRQIAAILEAGGMGREDVIRLNAFVTDRAHMAGYMKARDEWLAGLQPPPASTLVIVTGFTRPEFVVEVEATAAKAG